MSRDVVVTQLWKVPQTRGLHCSVNGLELAVFRVDGEVFAIADSCPHSGASLSNGKISGHMVACPAHGLKFDVRTGCSQVSPDLRNKTYPVRVDHGNVVLDLDAI